jgi:hypothetical protein
VVWKVQPVLRCAGAKPGEPVIADLRAEADLAGVATFVPRSAMPGALREGDIPTLRWHLAAWAIVELITVLYIAARRRYA